MILGTKQMICLTIIITCYLTLNSFVFVKIFDTCLYVDYYLNGWYNSLKMLYYVKHAK